MSTFPCGLIEKRTRHFWCLGGPSMPIDEVAFRFRLTPTTLRAALGHIVDLSYVTIRLAGLEVMSSFDSCNGLSAGFLINAHWTEILERDAEEYERLATARGLLCASYLMPRKSKE
ncbi:hypothetical protein J2Y55_002138 [Bosea sp. BE125]|uniref:hypothetical protein n=1 Tax=Bosea sp. BE125 TaxID=2817909 RepID=UPI002855E551|nr:hypothetical protein [Bosea sp. BE125]MDR6871130.1 hypothetical protein [Bosea sp. BE125]